MIRWQWQQLDHMQIICTLLQTDNHASTSSLNFYRPDALPDAQSKCTEGNFNIGSSDNKTTAPGKSGGLLQTARSTFRADIMRKWLLSEG